MGMLYRVLEVWTSCPSSACWIANSMAVVRGEDEAEGEFCRLVIVVISLMHLSTSVINSGICS